MEANSFQNNHQSSISQFLERSRCHIDKFYSSWRNGGETFIIPPETTSKIFEPVEVSVSFYDEELDPEYLPLFQNDAKGIVHYFLSKSNQPTFVLQNFTTSNWNRMLGSFGYNASDSVVAEMKNINDIEIDFLILHAYVGIIGIESKSVKNDHSNRSVVYQYNESKKRLNKIDDLVDNFQRILQVLHHNSKPVSVPIKKVVSFPFVDMKEEAKDPYNLGMFDVTTDPQIWWDRVLESNLTRKNRFVTSTLYHDFVLLILGMYNAFDLSVGNDMKDVYSQINEQSFFGSRTANPVCLPTTNEQPFFENLFFLNAEQQQVMKCQAQATCMWRLWNG